MKQTQEKLQSRSKTDRTLHENKNYKIVWIGKSKRKYLKANRGREAH